MMKSLVVYFSHNKENYFGGEIRYLDEWNTSVVAKKIQKLLECDIFEIMPLHEYPEKYDECTKVAKKELQEQARPKISNLVSHIEQYENIYLGFPNWWSTMPMCIWTFLESYDLTNKHIYPFCTHEGSGMGQSENDLKKICSKSIIHQGFAIRGSNVNNCDNLLRDWLNKKGSVK